jgi:hypothetical protein
MRFVVKSTSHQGGTLYVNAASSALCGGKSKMETPRPMESAHIGERESGPFRSSFAEAVRYLEPLQIFYNCPLAFVCAVWLVATWPHFRAAPDFFLVTLSRRPWAARKCLLLRRLFRGYSDAVVVAPRRLATLARDIMGDGNALRDSLNYLLDWRRDLSRCSLISQKRSKSRLVELPEKCQTVMRL